MKNRIERLIIAQIMTEIIDNNKDKLVGSRGSPYLWVSDFLFFNYKILRR